ncbi:hypothetical protein TWF718_006779 [Orbilia javanica]|uniref:Uncharacterized protein n=1 Tax=Orbilia javanica TaxID=47235 RepID=A0AAN8MXJ7_9PEZI
MAHFIVVGAPTCTAQDKKGSVLASSFFPDRKAHKRVLRVYPEAFKYSEDCLVGLFGHESGHILGLRHEFAKVKESYSACVVYGGDDKNSIMNYYDDLSKLKVSEDDKKNLRELYDYIYSRDPPFDEYGGFRIQLINPDTSGYCTQSVRRGSLKAFMGAGTQRRLRYRWMRFR